ncbi:YefM protein (antitoxin to YoeB) [hydrothermal vent metagenome]|uniref:YefM protein (Antitoxin to YoeB) n=1 Tax=hydrothermal vent metagenome TaxID=652676 RepID=A0A3B0VB76_9ZZZZ
MVIQVTYTEARANLAKLWDKVAQDKETVVITRRGAENVSLISTAELTSLEETAYLLRSPKNAERLLAALARSNADEGVPQTVEELAVEVGLGKKEEA